jgi:hypothetical protein
MIVETEIEIFDAELGVLDFDFAIVFGDFSGWDLT